MNITENLGAALLATLFSLWIAPFTFLVGSVLFCTLSSSILSFVEKHRKKEFSSRTKDIVANIATYVVAIGCAIGVFILSFKTLFMILT